MSEVWRPIPEWPDYEVSTQGRVRSLARSWIKTNGVPITIPDRVLAGRASRHDPYPAVTLHNRTGRGRREHVHALVAAAFLGPRPSGHEVCHLNDVPSDNRLENLEYGTSRKNKLDMVRNGRGNAGKTHCGTCGRALSGDNVKLKHGGRRRDCRYCQNEANRRYRARQRKQV